MKQNNSIINSLKRLERVGDETSKCTLKLKKACEDVATKILLNVNYLIDLAKYDIEMKHISEKLFLVSTSSTRLLCWDFDGDLGCTTFWDYSLYPEPGYISRKIALEFANAISNGLLEKVTIWIEKEKEKIDEANLMLDEGFTVQEVEEIKKRENEPEITFQELKDRLAK